MPTAKRTDSREKLESEARRIADELKSICTEFDISRNRDDQIFFAGVIAKFQASHEPLSSIGETFLALSITKREI